MKSKKAIAGVESQLVKLIIGLILLLIIIYIITILVKGDLDDQSNSIRNIFNFL